MTQLGFFFDSARCTGCKTCQLSCTDYKGLSTEFSLRKVLDYEGGGWTSDGFGAWNQTVFMYHLSLSCNHCMAPVCTEVCPTGAMHKEEETGLVLVNGKVCIGCGYCALSCPYGAPHVSKNTRTSKKCDGCVERLEEGKKPICVEACPLRALDFGDIDEMRRRGELNSIAPMTSAAHTKPSIAIKPSPAIKMVGDEDGCVVNWKEI